MHLAGRCTAATLALAAGAAIALLTLNGWRMPFAADGRGAVAALGIAGAAVYALCPAGRRPDALTSAVGVLASARRSCSWRASRSGRASC